MNTNLERLEAKLMLAEDEIEALNRTVYRQQQQLDLLQRQLQVLVQRVDNAQSGKPLSLREEVPPHY